MTDRQIHFCGSSPNACNASSTSAMAPISPATPVPNTNASASSDPRGGRKRG
jgi:hypothetical protein